MSKTWQTAYRLLPVQIIEAGGLLPGTHPYGPTVAVYAGTMPGVPSVENPSM
jgi:hypothetical protein